MDRTDLIGWTSSIILLVTIAQQVWKQWKDGATEGVSRWLFVGQLAASIGFSLYSFMKRDWVFVSTNGMMVVNALLGCWILARNKRRAKRSR